MIKLNLQSRFHHFFEQIINNKAFLKNWLSVTLILLLFFIPISITGRDICIVLVLIPLFLLMPSYYNLIHHIIREPWCLFLLMFLIFILMSCLWSPALVHEKIIILKKYTKFLCLLFLVLAFQISNSQKPAIAAFLSAMFITCCISILKYLGLINFSNLHDPGMVFFNHIITAMMMSYAAYISMALFFEEKGVFRIVSGILSVLFSYQILFINTGRMGYLLYLTLMVLLITQIYSLKKALFVLMFAGIVLLGVFVKSDTMRTRLKSVIHEVHLFVHNEKDSSLGYRIQFFQYSVHLFKNNPIRGNGTGSLTTSFRKDNPQSKWHSELFQPHNQYLFIIAENGLIGLALFGCFIFYYLMKVLELSSVYKLMGLGIVTVLLIGSMTDSLLYNSGAGCFILMMMSIFLSKKSIKGEEAFHQQSSSSRKSSLVLNPYNLC